MDIYNLIQEGKIKRFLRARNKLNFPGLVSHITQHASGRDPLFIEDGDYLYMLKLLKEVALKYQLSIFAFCWMTNHVHILLRQNEKNLSDAMHSLFLRYALYFNRKYSRKGHLFSGTFRQAACFDDYYLIVTSIYIHLNAVRAGLVGHYSRYRWSSWRLYCEDRETDSLIDWRFILSIIAGNHSEAREKYRKMLEEAMDYRTKEVQEVKTAMGKFVVWMKESNAGSILKGFKGGSIDLWPKGYASDREIMEAIEKLKGKKRLAKSEDFKARKFAAEQLQARGYSIQEIADYMNISRVTVYKIFKF
jgi:REP-associated tyrosine transposase